MQQYPPHGPHAGGATFPSAGQQQQQQNHPQYGQHHFPRGAAFPSGAFPPYGMNFHPQMGQCPPYFPPPYGAQQAWQHGHFGAPHGGNFGAPHGGNFGALHGGNFGAPHGGNFGGPPGPFGAPFYGQDPANFGTAPPVPAAPVRIPEAPPTAATAPAPAAAKDEPAPDDLDHLFNETEAFLYGDDEEEDAKIRQLQEGSGEYQAKKRRALEGFFQFIIEHPVLGPSLGRLVPSKNHSDPNHTVPAFVAAIQGLPSGDNKGQKILNRVCNAYFETMKGKDKKKPAEPSSVQTKMKMIFAALHADYDVNIGLANLTGQGSFHAYCQARWKVFSAADPKFGAKPYRLPLLDSEVELMVHMIRDPAFPLDEHLRQVTVLAVGCHYASRGVGDYYNLEWGMVEYGVFEVGHPFAGQEWVKVGEGLLSKANTLGLNNTTAKADIKAPHYPVRMGDPFCPGYMLRRLKDATATGAKFVFMSELGKKKKRQFKDAAVPGWLHWKFDNKVRMGKDYIGKAVQSLAKLAGIEQWQMKTNHTVRQNVITKLVNNPTVNPIEIKNLARHVHTETQHKYNRQTMKSEANMAAAIDIKPKNAALPHSSFHQFAGDSSAPGTQSGWI